MTDKPVPIPDLFARWFNPDGTPTSDAFIWFKQMDKVLRLNTDFVDTPVAAPQIVMPQQYPYSVAYPEDKDYVIIKNNDVERTITATESDCASGTCAATFKINSTPLGGTANSVSSTEQTQSHASANVLGVGDDLIVTISSNSSCTDMWLNVKTTRTITAT